MGFVHASLGFSAAVLVARVWEYAAREAHCSPTCPTFTSQAFRLHHSYYGMGLLIISFTVLALARLQRVRWDSSLFLGIGVGLLADEIGLLFLGIPYSSPLSILAVTIFAGAFFFATINASIREGTREFHVLDHSDVFTVTAILLGLSGILYLDRPLVQLVEALESASWISALVLLSFFGRTHFHRIWVGRAEKG